jgi:hypothetical protein
VFFGFNYKHNSNKYFMNSTFNGTPVTMQSNASPGIKLWNTSGNHYIRSGLTINPFHTGVCQYSFNDVRLYINHDSEGLDLLNTVRLQMNSLCVEGCQDCLSPGACSVCKSGFYLATGYCYPCHYTCVACSQGGKNGCTSCIDYLQLMSDSSCQVCPIGYAGQNGVCVEVTPQLVFTKDNS